MNINSKQEIIKLEQSLTKQDVRASIAELERLLSDNFLEFGASGVRFGKAEALALLPSEVFPEFTINDFELRELSRDVVQLIYRATIKMPNENIIKYSLRSSIWKKNDCGWQMEFHQGTPCEPF